MSASLAVQLCTRVLGDDDKGRAYTRESVGALPPRVSPTSSAASSPSAAPAQYASSAPELPIGGEQLTPCWPSATARASRSDHAPRSTRKPRRAAGATASASVARPLLPSDGERAPHLTHAHPTREEPDHLLDVNAAGVLLGIAPATLRNWAYQRRIPKVKLGGPRGPLRFRRSDLERYIRASTQGPLGARIAREVA